MVEDGRSQQADRVEYLREGTIMALYVSIVLLAALAALPAGGEGHGGHSTSGGVHNLELLALIWGTTLGLALAHWFAFRVVTHGFSGGRTSRSDLLVGVAQMLGAGLVAVLCSVPVVLFSDENDVQATTFVPALVIGVGAYFATRIGGRSKGAALVFGGTAIVIGLVVAAVKNVLAGH